MLWCRDLSSRVGPRVFKPSPCHIFNIYSSFPHHLPPRLLVSWRPARFYPVSYTKNQAVSKENQQFDQNMPGSIAWQSFSSNGPKRTQVPSSTGRTSQLGLVLITIKSSGSSITCVSIRKGIITLYHLLSPS